MPQQKQSVDQLRYNESGYGRLSKFEMDVLKGAFQDNTPLLQVVRKLLLPWMDGQEPIGHIIDFWTVQAMALETMTPEDCKIYFLARQKMIQQVDGGLLAIKTLAGIKEETEEEKAKRLALDSTK